MPDANDMDLVREFARNHSEAAFTELVRRHVNLVYSIARRCTGSDSDAKDVTQAVFVILARKAAGLRARTMLTGWLAETTRFTAACMLRTHARRHAREQEAYMQSILTDAAPADAWTRLAPHLEAGMAQLGERDRTLLTLRFYANKSGPEAAALLGIQEAAAHKRTARALEKLRKFFSQRGIELSAATIAAAVAANSVQAAPAGLAAAITAAALSGTAITTTAYLAATKAIAMTTIQKIAVTAALAVSVGVGIYQAKEAAKARADAQTLQQQQAPLAELIRQMQAERDKATNMLAWRDDELAKSKANNNELLRLRGEITQLKANENNASDQAATILLGKVNKIKQRIEATPGAKIPELHLATEEDWLQTAAKRLDSNIDYRRAMAHIRTLAKDKVASEFGKALNNYFQENKNQFPTDITQLKPFFKSPMDDAILQGWEIKSTDNFPLFKNVGKLMITENGAADFVFDSRHAVGDGWQSQKHLDCDPEQVSLFSTVVRAYEAANNGAKWNSGITSELLPYAKTPEQQNAIQNLMTSQSD